MTPRYRRLRAFLLLLALLLGGGGVLAPLAHAQASASRYTSGGSIAALALSYVGYRYAYIGDRPSTGFSCVGLVHYVYSLHGRYAPESVQALYRDYAHINGRSMRAGDVLIFANTTHWGLSHAAIYIGNGLMVGADNFRDGVRVDRVWDSYWGPKFVTAIHP